jgi:phenylacetate-CoA ligase
MTVEFTIRDFCYPIALLRLRRFFERSQWFSADELVRYQEQRLRQIIVQAYHHVPYYQDLFHRLKLRPADLQTLTDLQKLPTLSKATLRTEFQRLQATNGRRYRARLYQTSGTSGEPLRFLLDKPANVLEFVYYWRHWSWAGYRLGSRFAELTSHHFLKEESRTDQLFHYQALAGRLLLNSLSIAPGNVAAHAQALRTHRVRFLKGIASALYHFALFFQEQGIRDVSLQGVFSTGEMLLPYQRKTIAEVFHCRVLDSYGHMERTVAVSECPDGGLHINSEYGILELVEETPSRPVNGDGQVYTARVVGTSLHNFSMPLLRYEVGDLVEVDEHPEVCACGRALPRVRRINGRQEDVLVLPDGRVVTTLFIVFDQAPAIAQGQVIQEEPNRLRVRLVPTPAYTARSEQQFLHYLRRFVGRDMKVELEYLSRDALRRDTPGKFRTIISRLRKPSPSAALCGLAPQRKGD